MKTVNPLDSTFYLRRMKLLPNFSFVYFCTLLIFLIIFIVTTPRMHTHWEYPEFKYPQFERNYSSLIRFHINKNHQIWCNADKMNNIHQLGGYLDDLKEEWKKEGEELSRVALKLHLDTEFSVISKVLQQIQDAEIYTVFLAGGIAGYSDVIIEKWKWKHETY